MLLKWMSVVLLILPIEIAESSGKAERMSLSEPVATTPLEIYLSTAVLGETLSWSEITDSDRSTKNPEIRGHYTRIYAPLLYENDADKYGIYSSQVRNSYFALHLRKYQWGAIDRSKPIKHIILVSGGPGESGRPWINRLNSHFNQYGKQNVVLYVPDHRGVYRSRLVFKREQSSKKGDDFTWQQVHQSSHLNEERWIEDPIEFEAKIGYPLVSMTCSNAARDLALISLVLERFSTRDRSNNFFFLHAQSYGTQVALRALKLLPNFYEAILLEGLATMEIVRESAQSDFGIMSSCIKDPYCAKAIRKSPPRLQGHLIKMESVFDIRKMLLQMADGSHNSVCREYYHSQVGGLIYDRRSTFWDVLHDSLYEMLGDDFWGPYVKPRARNFYAGMLVVPLIRDMYYCSDVDRFRRQVDKVVEVISRSIRGLDRPYVNSPPRKRSGSAAKAKPSTAGSESASFSSYFVQSYINAHEAFDLRAMTHSAEKYYCMNPKQMELVNQCHIYQEQLKKMRILTKLTGKRDRFGSDVVVSADLKQLKEPKTEEGPKRKSVTASFEKVDTQRSAELIEAIHQPQPLKTIFLFDDAKISPAKSTARRTSGKSEKKIRLKVFKKNGFIGKRSESENDSGSEDDSEDESEDDSGPEDLTKSFRGTIGKQLKLYNKAHARENHRKSHRHGRQWDSLKFKGPKKAFSASASGSGSPTSALAPRRYYYDSDELAMQTSSSGSASGSGSASTSSSITRIFVVVGTLDVRTPILAARRLFSGLKAREKYFFELENVAHSTEFCRADIVRAYSAISRHERDLALNRAEQCVHRLKEERKLDWALSEAINIDPRDWWPE